MSALTVGFDRSLQVDWLDFTAQLAIDGVPRREAQQRLRCRLEGALGGQFAVQKTALVLVRVWYPDAAPAQRLRDEAAALVPALASSERLAVHWGLLLAAYPFFRAAAAIAGRLLRLQPTFTSSQLRDRLVQVYGDRAYVERARRHVVLSLVQWGVLAPPAGRGVYAPAQLIAIAGPAVERFLLHGRLTAAAGGMLPLDGLLSAPELFPFDIAHDAVSVARDPRFTISTVAGQQRLVSLAG